jgi:hypothetical protein
MKLSRSHAGASSHAFMRLRQYGGSAVRSSG